MTKDRGVSPITFLAAENDSQMISHHRIDPPKPSPTLPPLEEEQSKSVTIPLNYQQSQREHHQQRQQQSNLDDAFRIGQNVLARFADDGWYYKCTIEGENGEGAFIVRDRTDDTEEVWKEDVIDTSQERQLPYRVGELVIAEHPEFPQSYAPAVVIEDEDNEMKNGTRIGGVYVRFYDGHEAKVDRRNCFIISHAKFDEDTICIVRCEEQWVGQTVVVKVPSGAYEVGLVRERIGDGKNYSIELMNKPANGPGIIKQSSTHMFGRFTKARELKVGDRVLALFDPEKPEYLPGTIRSIYDPLKRSGYTSYRNSSQSGSSPALVMSPSSRSSMEDRQPLLTVKFINGATINGLMICHAFYLNNKYYMEAEKAYKEAMIASDAYATYAKGALKLGQLSIAADLSARMETIAVVEHERFQEPPQPTATPSSIAQT